MASTKTKVNMSRRPWNVLPMAVVSLIGAILMAVDNNSLLVNAFWWFSTAGFVAFFVQFWLHKDAVARNLALATIGLMGLALTIAVPAVLQVVQTRPAFYGNLIPMITLQLGIMFGDAILIVLPNPPRIINVLSYSGWLVFLAVFIIWISKLGLSPQIVFLILIILGVGIFLVLYAYYWGKTSKKEQSKE